MNKIEEVRKLLDEAIVNGFSNKKYAKGYLFYFHILAQCKISITNDVPTLGVWFNKTHFVLEVNPDFFESLKFEQRLGVLKHEMLHILFRHISRFSGDDINKEVMNIATDCAINQMIDEDHLPEGGITLDTVKEMTGNKKLKALESAEYYYNELMKNSKKQQNQCNSSGNQDEESDGDGNCQNKDNGEKQNKNSKSGDSSQGNGNKPLDDHSKWSKENEELQKQIAKKMVNSAIEKSRGNVPQELSDILELLNEEPKVSWQKVLRNIIASRKSGKERTIHKRNRRFRDRMDIKGHKVAYDKYIMKVIVDVSGSMSNDEILWGLNEIRYIAEKFKADIEIIQVDTEIKATHDFDKFKFERSGCGGTELYPAIEYINKQRKKPDIIIVISDMYIEDLSEWEDAPNCYYMFLGTDNKKPDGLENLKKAKYFDLKE